MREIRTPAAPPHAGPVPQAVAAGGWVFVSALFGTDPASGSVLPPSARDEASQLVDNLEAVLAAAGLGLTAVVRVGIYMRDLAADRPVFNDVWAARFGDHRPARSAIGVTDFGRPGLGARYMIDAIAFAGPA